MIWKVFGAHGVTCASPTCVTLGDMAKAQLANGDPYSAYDLVQEIRTEANNGKSVVNAVIWGQFSKDLLTRRNSIASGQSTNVRFVVRYSLFAKIRVVSA